MICDIQGYRYIRVYYTHNIPMHAMCIGSGMCRIQEHFQLQEKFKVTKYEEAVRSSWVWEELSRVRNFKPAAWHQWCPHIDTTTVWDLFLTFIRLASWHCASVHLAMSCHYSSGLSSRGLVLGDESRPWLRWHDADAEPWQGHDATTIQHKDI